MQNSKIIDHLNQLIKRKRKNQFVVFIINIIVTTVISLIFVGINPFISKLIIPIGGLVWIIYGICSEKEIKHLLFLLSLEYDDEE